MSHSYTSSLKHNVSCLMHRSAMACSSLLLNTCSTQPKIAMSDNSTRATVFQTNFSMRTWPHLPDGVIGSVKNDGFGFGIKFAGKFVLIQNPVCTADVCLLIGFLQDRTHEICSENSFFHICENESPAKQLKKETHKTKRYYNRFASYHLNHRNVAVIEGLDYYNLDQDEKKAHSYSTRGSTGSCDEMQIWRAALPRLPLPRGPECC